jgi:hypothetical protein
MALMVDSFKTGEVPKPTDLTRKIEVIGAGLGRTGTMSFSAALEKLLNGPVYHSGNMLISDEECIAAPPLHALSKLIFLPQQQQKPGLRSSTQSQSHRSCIPPYNPC